VPHYFAGFDSDRIVAEIAAAELKSSAEIRVHVTRRIPDNLEDRALRRFRILGMDRTEKRNGVLFYIAPRAHAFRILGDVGIHEKCGEEFWKDVANAMEDHFRRGDFTEGAARGIQRVGEALALHFPRESDDRNELPNQVTED
jgi:uncharacterized membrane protein